MPAVAPIAEFNRNQARVISELERTGEPLYLTRNGRAVVVVMDAAEFDRREAERDRRLAREQETYSMLMRGYQDVLEDRTLSLDEADERIRARKGW